MSRPIEWVETHTRLSSRDPSDLSPQDLEALADSAWLVCRLRESLATRQQAYAGCHQVHDDQSPVRMAWRLF